MKAKIKETGKWIIVDPCNDGFYDVNTHDIYKPDELDFAAEFDWKAFRREAAEEWLTERESLIRKEYYPFAFNAKDIFDAFEAGAEWMIKQGISVESEICKLAERAWIKPIDEKQFERDVYNNFVSGDKVIVQIRKK